MLFGDRIVFVHVPKTGGESIVEYLVRHLPGPKRLVDEPDWPSGAAGLPQPVRARLFVKAMLKRAGIWFPRSVSHVAGKRHARLFEIRKILAAQNRRLEEFSAILAVVRNPYDLEVSRYHYLRRGRHGVPGLARSREQRIAIECDFEQFALSAPYQGQLPAKIQDWYQLDGAMPANLRILRFETLEADLHGALAGFCATAGRLPKRNASAHGPYPEYLSSRSEQAIFDKYRWLFDAGFYSRESFFTARRS